MQINKYEIKYDSFFVIEDVFVCLDDILGFKQKMLTGISVTKVHPNLKAIEFIINGNIVFEWKKEISENMNLISKSINLSLMKCSQIHVSYKFNTEKHSIVISTPPILSEASSPERFYTPNLHLKLSDLTETFISYDGSVKHGIIDKGVLLETETLYSKSKRQISTEKN